MSIPISQFIPPPPTPLSPLGVHTFVLYICVNFCCTAKWISFIYTVCVFIKLFLDYFPILVITEYWIEFPVLYSKSLLVIYFIYSSVYMSIPISQFIPSPPSPLANTRLFSTSVTLFLAGYFKLSSMVVLELWMWHKKEIFSVQSLLTFVCIMFANVHWWVRLTWSLLWRYLWIKVILL